MVALIAECGSVKNLPSFKDYGCRLSRSAFLPAIGSLDSPFAFFCRFALRGGDDFPQLYSRPCVSNVFPTAPLVFLAKLMRARQV